MTKIVRKVDQTSGYKVAVWLNPDDRLVAWAEFDGASTADEEIERRAERAGWFLSDADVRRFFGTTLSALRAELTEEGEDGLR